MLHRQIKSILSTIYHGKKRLIDDKGDDSTAPGELVTVSGSTYTVTSVESGTVAFTDTKNAKSVTIPASIMIGDETYRVTAVNTNAFKGAAVTKVTVGKNVSKTVQVKVGTSKQNKTYVKKYKKFFTKANAGRKVTVK